MQHIYCPNCQNISRYWRHCEFCYFLLPAGLDPQATEGVKGTIDPQALMDGHLIRLVSSIEERGIVKPAAVGTKQNEVMVIAKVKSTRAFEKAVGKQNVNCKIKGATKSHPYIVTARVPVASLKALRSQPTVLSLKASRRYRPCLEKTMREVGADESSLPRSLTAHGGEGVIIGIVDFGLDFCHHNFRQKEGLRHTRILALWDQKATSPSADPPSGVKYGRVYEQEEINVALSQGDPYSALGYRPPLDGNTEIGAHGTYVTDVAAGNGGGSSQPGIAPEADIVFVDVAVGDLNSGENISGENVAILEAVDFIFAYASKRKRPCVINISLGNNNGPHDGSSLVERGIDRLVQAAPNRAVVIAAGNSADRKIHTVGQLKQGKELEVLWQIPDQDRTRNEMEIWYAGSDEVSLQIMDPNQQPVNATRLSLGTYEPIPDAIAGDVLIVNRAIDPNNGENTINIFIAPGAQGGTWRVRLKGEQVKNGSFHAWIERDEFGQSSFGPATNSALDPVKERTTLNSLACGRNTIVVGAYNALEADTPALSTSSWGPTKDGRLKPDVAAPGYSILAARSRTEVLRARQTGTSLSAAVVSGIVALLLSEAQKRGIDLSAEQIRNILTLTAQPPAVGGDLWHPQYGYGRVRADAALAVLTALTR